MSASSNENVADHATPATGQGAGYVSRPKRIACVICRRRKLRCDGSRPSCGTCSRLGHQCAYDEVRKKSGPKRGYVKQLEARLAKVETLLKTKEPSVEQVELPKDDRTTTGPIPSFTAEPTMDSLPDIAIGNEMLDPTLAFGGDPLFDMNDNDFTWEMISLGVEEPLPDPEVVKDLFEIYFERVHINLPMIHRGRFYMALNLSPYMKPPVCLRYAMWTHAACLTPRYSSLVSHFYTRARKYAEADEMRSQGEGMVSVAHAQCWALIAAYEFKTMMFPRAWQSCGRATRLCQMMGLHRMDGGGIDVKQCIPPPRDWTEREERRRTFWIAFCHDRYASVGTGWPFTVDERDIFSHLPATDEAYQTSRFEKTPALVDVLESKVDGVISPLAGVCLTACMFGRVLHHLHRPDKDDNDQDLNCEFWSRHRRLDNVLLTTSLALPASLKLPQGISDPNTIFCNLNLHTSGICLHQAAIFRADRNRKGASMSSESKRRCIVAAEQIANIMRMVSTIDLSTLNPFSSFSIYVAARVFIQYLKSASDDEQASASLQFLLAAMDAMKATTPLTGSFIAQLDLDLEACNLGRFSREFDLKAVQMKMRTQSNGFDTCRAMAMFDHDNDQPSQLVPNAENGPTMISESGIQPSQPAKNSDSFPSMWNNPFKDSGNTDNSFGTDLSRSTMSTSGHPTPSTLSQKDSSNNSTSSPNMEGVNSTASGTTNSTHPLYQQEGVSLTYNLLSNGTSLPPEFDLPSGWNIPFDGVPSTTDPKSQGFSGGTSQPDGSQYSMALGGMGWNGWNDLNNSN